MSALSAAVDAMLGRRFFRRNHGATIVRRETGPNAAMGQRVVSAAMVASVAARKNAIACVADVSTAEGNASMVHAAVEASRKAGEALNIDSTPTLFINGRKIENVNGTPYEVMKQMVTFEAQEAQKK